MPTVPDMHTRRLISRHLRRLALDSANTDILDINNSGDFTSITSSSSSSFRKLFPRCDYYRSSRCYSRAVLSTAAIIGLVCGLAFLLANVVVGFILWRRHRRKKEQERAIQAVFAQRQAQLTGPSPAYTAVAAPVKTTYGGPPPMNGQPTPPAAAVVGGTGTSGPTPLQTTPGSGPVAIPPSWQPTPPQGPQTVQGPEMRMHSPPPSEAVRVASPPMELHGTSRIQSPPPAPIRQDQELNVRVGSPPPTELQGSTVVPVVTELPTDYNSMAPR